MKYLCGLFVAAIIVGCGTVNESIEVKQGAETTPACGLTACQYYLTPPHVNFAKVVLKRGEVAIFSGTGYSGTCQMLFAPSNGSTSTEYDLAAKGWFPSTGECGFPDPNGTHGSRIRSFVAGPDTTFVLFPAHNGDPTMQGGQYPCQACMWSQNQTGDAVATCASRGEATTFQWASVRARQTPTNAPGFPGWAPCSGYGTTGTYYSDDLSDPGNICGAPTTHHVRLCSGMYKGNCVWVAPLQAGVWQNFNFPNGYWHADMTGTGNMPLASHTYGYYDLGTVETNTRSQVRFCYSGDCSWGMSEGMAGWAPYLMPTSIQLYWDP